MRKKRRDLRCILPFWEWILTLCKANEQSGKMRLMNTFSLKRKRERTIKNEKKAQGFEMQFADLRVNPYFV